MRGFDRLFYAALILGFIFVVYRPGQEGESYAPEAPTETIGQQVVGPPLPPPTAFDPQVRVELPEEVGQGSGTAFAIGPGVWMTARHVVDGCARVGLLTSPNDGVLAERIEPSNGADLALVYAALERPALAIDFDESRLELGEYAFHVGYPQGRAGEASSRLMGRETLYVSGRYATREPVIAWVETSRTRGLSGTLGGMSGGPVFDREGAIIGVTVAEAPRRGRIYTASPESLAALVRAANVRLPAEARRAGAIAPETYGDAANQLRRSLRVAKVVCLPAEA